VVFFLYFDGCTHSSQPGAGNLSVSGKTYLLGSVTPTSGVLVKCAGVSSTSDVDGTFELSGVPEGKQILTAERADCKPYSDTIDVNSDTRRYVYLRIKTTKIWGYVSNSVDGPIQGASVKLKGYSVVTDATGRYDLPPVTGSSDTLVVTRTPYIVSTMVIALDSAQKQVNVALIKQEFIYVPFAEATYVDQARPDVSFGTSSSLLLSSNPLNQTGNERNIYLRWDFPAILQDQRKTVYSGVVQLSGSLSGSVWAIQTYALTSAWSASSLTYLTQPSRGVLLETVNVGGYTGYYSILSASSVLQMINDWRANKPFFGVVILGGPTSGAPLSFANGGVNYLRLVIVLRY
jgi:hypothetical protein